MLDPRDRDSDCIGQDQGLDIRFFFLILNFRIDLDVQKVSKESTESFLIFPTNFLGNY